MADVLKETPITAVQVEALVGQQRRSWVSRSANVREGGYENHQTLPASLSNYCDW
jgi:hypothetical protein